MSLGDPLQVRAAVPGDLEPVLELFESVRQWLVGKGRTDQWGSVSLAEDDAFRERLGLWIDRGDVLVAMVRGRLVGAIALGELRPPSVPVGQISDDSLYIYTVATARTDAGRNVGASLMAAAETRAAGRPTALDHWAGSPELASLYAAYGYEEVACFGDNVLRVKPPKQLAPD